MHTSFPPSYRPVRGEVTWDTTRTGKKKFPSTFFNREMTRELIMHEVCRTFLMTRKSNHFHMLEKKQHFLFNYFKALSVGPSQESNPSSPHQQRYPDGGLGLTVWRAQPWQSSISFIQVFDQLVGSHDKNFLITFEGGDRFCKCCFFKRNLSLREF